MRRKLLILTLGLTSSMWSAGCQQRPPVTAAAAPPSRENIRVSVSGTPAATVGPTKSSPWRTPESADPVKQPGSRAVLIISEDAGSAGRQLPPATAPREAPGKGKATQVPLTAPRQPTGNLQIPSATPPHEAPLPPPSLPKQLPAPSGLQPSHHQSVAISRKPAADTAPLQPQIHNQAPPPSAAVHGNGGAPSQAVAPSQDSHRTLTGEVQQFRRTWRLRYASIDAEDPHGGSVTLDGPGLERLQDGARIRVTGALLLPDDRRGSVRFQVQSLEVLEPQR